MANLSAARAYPGVPDGTYSHCVWVPETLQNNDGQSSGWRNVWCYPVGSAIPFPIGSEGEGQPFGTLGQSWGPRGPGGAPASSSSRFTFPDAISIPGLGSGQPMDATTRMIWAALIAAAIIGGLLLLSKSPAGRVAGKGARSLRSGVKAYRTVKGFAR